LRRHFEVNAAHVTAAVLGGLCQDGVLPPATVDAALRDLAIEPDRLDPIAA